MKQVFLLLFLFCLPFALGLEIVGDHVIYENAYAKLDVWPHTDINISDNPVFSQEFKITNKTNQQQELYFAFVFNKPLLSARAFNLEQVTKTVDSFGWVSNSFQCNFDFNYSLNVFPNSVNPHSLNCFDVNAEGINFIKKDFPFYSGNLENKTVNFFEWDLNGTKEIQVPEYVNRSDKFNFYFSPFKNKAYYYIKIPYVFDPESSNQFKIFYQPDPLDKTNKWDLIAWQGNSWDCILFDSCNRVFVLDPNWLKAEASYRYPINISMGATGSDTNTTFILNANMTDFGLTSSDDSNRLLVFDQSFNSEIARVIDFDKTTGDLNIFFRPLIPLAPNIDYNGIDTNGLMIYVVDVNYSDQNESWLNSFWWGSNFEVVAEQGSWDTSGDSGTWSYVSGTQLDGSTGTIKKGVYAGELMNARLQNYSFEPTADYNLFIQVDSKATDVTRISMQAPGFFGSPYQEFNIRAITTLFRLDVQGGARSEFGVSAANTWYRMKAIISLTAETGKVLSYESSVPNGTLQKILGLKVVSGDLDMEGYFDNLRVYKILLNPPTVSLGAQESSALSPDVNLNYPNGAETFYKTQSYDLNFSVQDGDSNSLLVDLNLFQDSNNFVIINDINTDSVTISCVDSDFTNSTFCIYSWIVPEGIVSGDWNLTVFVSDGSNSAQDSTDANFTITIIPVPTSTEETSERFFNQEDPRFIDSERFISPDDTRIEDSNRFMVSEDSRQESDVFNNKVLFKENQNLIIGVLIIILIIIVAWFAWKRK